jgi:hypothetical protein
VLDLGAARFENTVEHGPGVGISAHEDEACMLGRGIGSVKWPEG